MEGREHHFAGSFVYPLRGRWLRRWALGVVLLLFFPIGWVPLFGYAVACVRSVAISPQAPPPAWAPAGRLLRDGCWALLQAGLLTLPFGVVAWSLGGLVASRWHPFADPFTAHSVALASSAVLVALPWGLLMLALVPSTLARFAVSGRPVQLAAVGTALRDIRHRYLVWNLVVVTICSAWLLAALGLALLAVGAALGAFYAILVSAHACAALAEPPWAEVDRAAG